MLGQTTIALDLYLAYLRAAFHTCYYCAVTTDHLEELQRKCIMHVRKPMTKAMKEELVRAPAGDAKVKDEDMKDAESKQDDEKDGEQNGSGDRDDKDEGKDKEGKRDVMLKERTGDSNRDWRRNGMFAMMFLRRGIC